MPAGVTRALEYRAAWIWRLVFWPMAIAGLWFAAELAQMHEWAFWVLAFFGVWGMPWLPAWYWAGFARVDFWLACRAARFRAAHGFWPGSGHG